MTMSLTYHVQCKQMPQRARVLVIFELLTVINLNCQKRK